jgi:hypothetical protein
MQKYRTQTNCRDDKVGNFCLLDSPFFWLRSDTLVLFFYYTEDCLKKVFGLPAEEQNYLFSPPPRNTLSLFRSRCVNMFSMGSGGRRIGFHFIYFLSFFLRWYPLLTLWTSWVFWLFLSVRKRFDYRQGIQMLESVKILVFLSFYEKITTTKSKNHAKIRSSEAQVTSSVLFI